MTSPNSLLFRAAALTAAALPMAAQAFNFDVPLGDESIEASLDTSVTVGVGVRMQDRSSDLIGKANLDPGVCTGPNGAYQSCQGVFKDQLYPAQRLVAAPGAPSINNDDGNLNYGKGDLISAPLKVTTDLALGWRDIGFFAKWLYFYDFVNNDFREYHPNRITRENYRQVGREVPQTSISLPSDPRELLANPYGLFTSLLTNRPWGEPGPNGGRLSYGPGGVVRERRRDGETLREIGTDFQLLDALVYGKLPLWAGRQLTVKVGRQTVNWGESTMLVLNSINQANPVNANNFNRIGYSVNEVFTPIGMVFASFEPWANTTLEGYYQLEWQNVEAPAPGSFFSDLDIGTDNAGSWLSPTTGGLAEDTDQIGRPADSPLSSLSNSSTSLRRLTDRRPQRQGQFGIAVKSYIETLGNGVELAGYFLNYHSRLPIASLYSAHASCARREGNALGLDARDLVTFFAACPDVPLLHALTHPQQPEARYATDSALPLDSVRFQLEYPENIRLYGLSFNAVAGDYSFQGEVAYRPDQPLQVDVQDLAFAALAPTLTRCHDRTLACAGSAQLGNIGIGYAEDGNATSYGPSEFTDASGRNPYPDVLTLGLGHLPGSARSFPSFVIPYRGGTVGENPPCAQGMSDAEYHPGIDCYIRGYERMAVYQFNFGTTRVLGATENPLGADQIIWVSEWGATWVPELPSLDQLQFEAPGTYYHASAGADGSAADGSRQACSTNPACTVGPDGLRFNPHQQDLRAFPDPLSWGYRLIGIFSYESVLPSISLRPVLTWAHDVKGTSPGPAGSFVEGRKQAGAMLETRYRDSLSFNLGYTWFFGGGSDNTLRDRDYAQFFVRYQF